MNSIPSPTVRFAPIRVLSRGVSGATTIMIGAIGSRRTAAPSGLYPRMSWRYCVSRNITPNIDMKISTMPAVPVLNAGFSKNRTSSMGSSVCSSQRTNASSTTAPTRERLRA